MNILITGAWAEAKEYIPEIEGMGHKVMFLQQEKDALPCNPDWAEGVICNGLFLSHPIDEFTGLRYIQLTSAGFDRVPMDYVKEKNIEIHNARGVYSIPMAEFAVAGVLQLYKGLDIFKRQQQKREWSKRRDLRELNGKKVLIAGCGSVGTECARRFAAFGCHVTGIDELTRKKEPFREILPPACLEEELGEADILVLTLPLTEETKGLIGEKQLQLMKPDALLVNISRGGVIDEKALVREMKRIGGAVLDVFEEEPLPEESPLWAMENVIITPHNSFVGDGNRERLADLIMRNVSKQR